MKLVFDPCASRLSNPPSDGEWVPIALSRTFDSLQEARNHYGLGNVGVRSSNYAVVEIEVDVPDGILP